MADISKDQTKDFTKVSRRSCAAVFDMEPVKHKEKLIEDQNVDVNNIKRNIKIERNKLEYPTSKIQYDTKNLAELLCSSSEILYPQSETVDDIVNNNYMAESESEGNENYGQFDAEPRTKATVLHSEGIEDILNYNILEKSSCYRGVSEILSTVSKNVFHSDEEDGEELGIHPNDGRIPLSFSELSLLLPEVRVPGSSIVSFDVQKNVNNDPKLDSNENALVDGIVLTSETKNSLMSVLRGSNVDAESTLDQKSAYLSFEEKKVNTTSLRPLQISVTSLLQYKMETVYPVEPVEIVDLENDVRILLAPKFPITKKYYAEENGSHSFEKCDTSQGLFHESSDQSDTVYNSLSVPCETMEPSHSRACDPWHQDSSILPSSPIRSGLRRISRGILSCLPCSSRNPVYERNMALRGKRFHNVKIGSGKTNETGKNS